MKNLILFCIFPLVTLAQSVVSIQMPGESAISVTMSAEAVSSTIAGIVGGAAQGTPITTTLTSSATNVQTTFTVASVTGVTTCMGILIGSELSNITAISGTGPFTLTVIRHTVGTTAAAYNSGQVVSYTTYGQGGCALAAWLTQGVQGFMSAGAFPGPIVAAQKAAINTANTTIQSTITAAVTHVP